MGLDYTTALEAGKLIKEKKISSPELTKYMIENIAINDEAIGAYLAVNKEQALKKAYEIQAKIDSGELSSPLAGVPIAIKDNICTKGVATTCASKILENYIPPYNATVIDKLEAAGAIILGKLNMDEFAMGSTCETSALKLTKNPWNTECVPGGSSGGAAAAVAAYEAIAALGSDTGGSIRQPASFCGVTGIKPTYGSVSRYGVVAYASSLDQVGPIARTAEDCAALLSIISGHDKKDSTSINMQPFDFTKYLNMDVKGMKIGIPTDYFSDALDIEVKEAVLKGVQTLKELGAIVEEFQLSLLEYAIPAYYIISSSEASSNLSRFDGVKYGLRPDNYGDLQDLYKKSRSLGFGDEVKRRIMLGSFLLSAGHYDAYYLKALKVKNLIKQSFDRAFEKYDIIIGPTATQTAYKIGSSLSDPLKMYLGDIYTVSVNLAGLPGMSLPCGFDSNNMPIGMQIIAKPFGEGSIFQVAHEYQRNTDFHTKKPILTRKKGA